MEFRKTLLAALSTLFVLAQPGFAMDESSGDEGKSTQSIKRSSETLDSSIPQDIPYGRVVDLGNDVYAGAGIAGSGETIYFSMQKITPENQADIENFKYSTLKMSNNNGRGALGAAFAKGALEGKWPDGYEDLNYGFTFTEFEGFIQHIQKNVLAKHAATLGAAAIGQMTTQVGDYVAYISKEPITGPRSFLKEYNSSKTVKNYFEDTKDLIMMVGCSLSKKRIYNRGIERTLYSFYFDNGRSKGVSLAFHAFTAAVAKVIDPTTEIFEVHPMDKMTEIICDAFGPECARGKSAADTVIEMPIDTVGDLYRTAARKSDPAHSGS